MRKSRVLKASRLHAGGRWPSEPLSLPSLPSVRSFRCARIRKCMYCKSSHGTFCRLSIQLHSRHTNTSSSCSSLARCRNRAHRTCCICRGSYPEKVHYPSIIFCIIDNNCACKQLAQGELNHRSSNSCSHYCVAHPSPRPAQSEAG